MSKFWGATFAILFIGTAGLFLAGATQDINFTDLETECRFDRGEDHTVSVTNNNELQFSGYFPVQNTQADMKYTFSESNDNIVLNVFAEGDSEPQDFENTCYAVGVYEASTDSYEGQKWVTVKHQGERVEKFRVDFR